MAWIESHQGLAAHPKTKKLIRRLAIPGPVIVGHLHYLWWWALDYAQDGEITQYDPFDIADACEWKGDAKELYEALIHSGFIDKHQDRYFIHDWYDYAGKLIEIRKKDAERKRKSRGKSKDSDVNPEDVQRTSIGHPEDSEGRRKESVRDLDLNLDLNKDTTTTADVHTKVFGTLMMGGLMQDYVMTLKGKGYTDFFIQELMLETGESGNKPSLRLMQTIGERWMKEGIHSRSAAKELKDKSKTGGFPKGPKQYAAKVTKPKMSYEEMSDKFAGLRESEDENGIA